MLDKIFFLNDPSTTDIYTLSLHDALPIYPCWRFPAASPATSMQSHGALFEFRPQHSSSRSEEHTSELQSRLHLVCRLLLEKKKITFSAIASDSPNACRWAA